MSADAALFRIRDTPMVTVLIALTRGAFAEYQEHLDAKIEALVASLHPRDPIEHALGRRIAGLLHQMDRVDLEACLLAADAKLSPDERERRDADCKSGELSEKSAAFHLWLTGHRPDIDPINALELVKFICVYMKLACVPEPLHATYLDTALEDADGNAIMNAVVEHLFAGDRSSEIRELRRTFENTEEQITARRMIETIERFANVRTRHGALLARALVDYQTIRDRDLHELADSDIESRDSEETD